MAASHQETVPFDFASLKRLLSSPELIDTWTLSEQDTVNEASSDCEEQAAITEIIFEWDDDNASLAESYSHTDGLAALPRLTQPKTREEGPPGVGEALLAGKYEDAIRLGLKVERTRLFETASLDPAWDGTTRGKYGRLFYGWEALTAYKLPAASNLVQSVIDRHQDRWDSVGGAVNVLGSGAEVNGLFGIIRNCFTYKDWLSLYKAQERSIYAWKGRDESNKDDIQIIDNLEHQLFDTSKYYGASELMTVMTYGKGQYGTLALFRTTLTPEKPELPSVAASIEPLAHATQVPRAILRGLKVNNRIELVQKKGRIRCLWQSDQPPPSPARIFTASVNKKGKKSSTPWESIGHGWRRALGMACEDSDDDGLVATIPFMLALLHLKGSALHNLASTPVEVFEAPLRSVPHPEDVKKKSHPGWEVKRGVKILRGPDRDGHDGDRVKVVVMFPMDSAWAKELLLWA